MGAALLVVLGAALVLLLLDELLRHVANLVDLLLHLLWEELFLGGDVHYLLNKYSSGSIRPAPLALLK